MTDIDGIVREAFYEAVLTSVAFDGIKVICTLDVQKPIQYTANQIITAFPPYLVREIAKGLVLSSGRSFPACALIIVATSALAGAYKSYSRARQQGRSPNRADILAGLAEGTLYSLANLAGVDRNFIGCVVTYSGMEFVRSCIRAEGKKSGSFTPSLLLQSLVRGTVLGISRQGFGVAGSMVISMTSMPLAPLVGAIAASSFLAYSIYLSDTQRQRGGKNLVTKLSVPLLSVSVMATVAGAPLLPGVGGIYTLALIAFAIESYKFSVPIKSSALVPVIPQPVPPPPASLPPAPQPPASPPAPQPPVPPSVSPPASLPPASPSVSQPAPPPASIVPAAYAVPREVLYEYSFSGGKKVHVYSSDTVKKEADASYSFGGVKEVCIVDGGGKVEKKIFLPRTEVAASAVPIVPHEYSVSGGEKVRVYGNGTVKIIVPKSASTALKALCEYRFNGGETVHVYGTVGEIMTPKSASTARVLYKYRFGREEEVYIYDDGTVVKEVCVYNTSIKEGWGFETKVDVSRGQHTMSEVQIRKAIIEYSNLVAEKWLTNLGNKKCDIRGLGVEVAKVGLYYLYDAPIIQIAMGHLCVKDDKAFYPVSQADFSRAIENKLRIEALLANGRYAKVCHERDLAIIFSSDGKIESVTNATDFFELYAVEIRQEAQRRAQVGEQGDRKYVAAGLKDKAGEGKEEEEPAVVVAPMAALAAAAPIRRIRSVHNLLGARKAYVYDHGGIEVWEALVSPGVMRFEPINTPPKKLMDITKEQLDKEIKAHGNCNQVIKTWLASFDTKRGEVAVEEDVGLQYSDDGKEAQIIEGENIAKQLKANFSWVVRDVLPIIVYLTKGRYARLNLEMDQVIIFNSYGNIESITNRGDLDRQVGEYQQTVQDLCIVSNIGTMSNYRCYSHNQLISLLVAGSDIGTLWQHDKDRMDEFFDRLPFCQRGKFLAQKLSSPLVIDALASTAQQDDESKEQVESAITPLYASQASKEFTPSMAIQHSPELPEEEVAALPALDVNKLSDDGDHGVEEPGEPDVVDDKDGVCARRLNIARTAQKLSPEAKIEYNNLIADRWLSNLSIKGGEVQYAQALGLQYSLDEAKVSVVSIHWKDGTSDSIPQTEFNAAIRNMCVTVKLFTKGGQARSGYIEEGLAIIFKSDGQIESVISNAKLADKIKEDRIKEDRMMEEPAVIPLTVITASSAASAAGSSSAAVIASAVPAAGSGIGGGSEASMASVSVMAVVGNVKSESGRSAGVAVRGMSGSAASSSISSLSTNSNLTSAVGVQLSSAQLSTVYAAGSLQRGGSNVTSTRKR